MKIFIFLILLSAEYLNGRQPSLWGEWSTCSSSCGRGLRHRFRKCSENATAGCDGNKVQTAGCLVPFCWSQWVQSRTCSDVCGISNQVQTRYRVCLSVFALVTSGRDSCKGESLEEKKCDVKPCKSQSWGDWSNFSPCSKSCGQGSRYRTRRCLDKRCIGLSFDVSGCQLRVCTSLHQWSTWSKFGCCSVSCGKGVRVRRRRCMNEADKFQKSTCEGDATQVISCYVARCELLSSLDRLDCGRKNTSIKKIFGGEIAGRGWRWQASWQQRRCSGCWWRHFCGASLISSRWVLTAGHCIQFVDIPLDVDHPSNDLSVLVGTNNLHNGGERRGIERIFLHPDYLYKYVTFADIALIKLKTSVQESTFITSICLPPLSSHDIFDENCYVTGWGYTGPLNDPKTRKLPTLREASIRTLPFDKCLTLGKEYRQNLNNISHMCAGDPVTARRDACRGDSGGPLSCYDNQRQKWYLKGVTSFSFKRCGTPGHVGIYAPVTSYVKWIRLVIDNDNRGLC